MKIRSRGVPFSLPCSADRPDCLLIFVRYNIGRQAPGTRGRLLAHNSVGKPALLSNAFALHSNSPLSPIIRVDHARTPCAKDFGGFYGDTLQAVLCYQPSAMTGRRLLDIAAIFKASRGVATKHVAIRQHQLDVYTKTSSLAKAIKSQTDRVTLTVKAASDLAKRFDGPKPGPDDSPQAQPGRSSQHGSIPSQTGASGMNEGSQKKNGIFQDHFYKKSTQNTSAESPPNVSQGIKQENAERYSLPDGSVLPANPVEDPRRDKESYSELPQTEPPKAPLADGKEDTVEGLQPISSGRTSIPNPAKGNDLTSSGKDEGTQQKAEKDFSSQAAKRPPAARSEEPSLQADRDRDVFYTPLPSDEQRVSALPRVKLPKNMKDAQTSNEPILDAQINQDVFYSSSSKSEEQAVPQTSAVPEQEEPSDEAYNELFHNPRVARMLSGQAKSGKPSDGLEMAGALGTPVKQTKVPKEKDQVLSSVRVSEQRSQEGARSPSIGLIDSMPIKAEGSDNVHNLAADIANDAATMTVDPAQINSVRNKSMILMLID